MSGKVIKTKHKNYYFWKSCDIIDEMGKVDINEPKATTTARDGRSDELQRGKHLERAHIDLAGSSEVERNVGVDMSAKNQSGAKNKNGGENAKQHGDHSRQKQGGQNGRVEQKQSERSGQNRQSNQSRAPKRLALPAGAEGLSVKKNIAVHDELDSGMALMASRAAATEYQRPDITKIKQQRGKSMSGLVMDVQRSHMRPTSAVSNNVNTEAAATEKEPEEAKEEKERFSKTWSTLIGVGVALVVAVIGFAAIAIFGNNKEKCVVAFESNGGSKVESTEVVCGRTVSQPSDPTKDGFEFDGWIFEGDPFDFSTGIYKNATLVAKWKASEGTETVTVSFDTDGGSAISPIEVAKGKMMQAPNEPTKTNWAFSGWYYDGKEFDFSQPIEQDMTLKANWKWAPATTNNSGGNSSGSNGNGGNNNSGSNSDSNNGSSSGNGNVTVDDQNKPDDGKTDNPSGDNDPNKNPGGNTGGNSGETTEPTNPENPGGNTGGNSGETTDPDNPGGSTEPENPGGTTEPTTPENPGENTGEGDGGGSGVTS